MAKNSGTEAIVEDLLNRIFGIKDSHKNIAYELTIKYSDARGSLISVLRYLETYKDAGLL